MTKLAMLNQMIENLAKENKDHPQHTVQFEEEKKSIRQTSDVENLSEFELCRKYSKTRSMVQD